MTAIRIMLRKRRTTSTLTAVLVMGALLPASAQATPAVERPVSEHSVTLITGDRVVLNGDRLVAYEPAPGRAGVPVHTYVDRGHRYVVPADAEPHVLNGKLDRRLFDVTSMVGFGYDDANRSTVPVLVRGRARSNAKVPTLSVQQDVPVIGAVSGTVEKSGASWNALRGDAVEKVWLNGMRQLALDRSTTQIGAPQAWQAGFTGKGVRVAVLDSGVDENHPDLKGSQVAERNFTDAPDATDDVGHGTHVAATIVGRDATYRGVAPEAELLDAKVCTRSGCQDAALIAGMQWAADQGATVINMSLGGRDTPEVDPVEEALDRISRETGALFVVSAGNEGEPSTIGSPGSVEAALTVGAVDRTDAIAALSSRGPTVDGAVKPDVTAPGMGIVAAQAGTTGRVARSGTSMAAPHVAGVAALLKQRHPDWKATQLKGVVTASAAHNPAATPFDQGAGRVDVPKALAQHVHSEPTSLNFGLRDWPHDDDEKVVRKVTYHNTGDAPVTLDLSTEISGPGGPAPAGMFTVSPPLLTVPAGGSAEATVTADTTVPARDGMFSGAVMASGMRTLVSLDREPESYDISFDHVGFDGLPTTQGATTLTNIDTGKRYTTPPGRSSLRLPKGQYRAEAAFQDPEVKFALLIQPRLRIDGNADVVYDARSAKPIVLRAPEASATPLITTISLTSTVAGQRNSVGYAFLDGLQNSLSIAQIGEDSPGFTTSFAAQFAGSEGKYSLLWTERDHVPTGYERVAERSDLAEMVTHIVSGGPGRKYRMGANAQPHDGSGWFTVNTPVDGTRDVRDFVTAASAEWSWSFSQGSEQGRFEVEQHNGFRPLTAGRTHEQTVNSAVFGPSVRHDSSSLPTLARLDDLLLVAVPMFTDSNGGTGLSAVDAGHVSLFRDGVQMGQVADDVARFEVPGEDAAYRAEVMLERSNAELTTKVSGAWTFRSKHDGGLRILPMSVVRFVPELKDNAAHGPTLRIPLQVQQQEGTPEITHIEAGVSFDDGATWQKATVADDAVQVVHEPGARFASLRARTTDAAGNTSEVTIIRAYRIGS